MKVNFVGKSILLLGIVLLSLAILGQPALADNDDKCVPLIKAVNINFSEEGNSISIMGECFGNENPPEVTLCGVELPVIHNTETIIDSILIHDPGADDCVLTVCTDDDEDACDRFWIGFAPSGPEGSPYGDSVAVMQCVWVEYRRTIDYDWVDIAGRKMRCWKRCNPKTQPKAWWYHGRKYEWVCLCDARGCCHWAPPLLPLPPKEKK